jgi:hypothetical protein
MPNAGVCTKCGNALNQISNVKSGGSAEEEYPPTMMSPQFMKDQTAPGKKGNKKIFLIVGIVVVLLVVFTGLLGIAAIGGYVYFSNQPTVVRENTTPASKKDQPVDKDADDKDVDDGSPLSDIKFPSNGGNDGVEIEKNTGNEGLSNAKLIVFFSSEKSKVGRFLLSKVKTIDADYVFSERIAGVTANYKKGSTPLTHSFAAYQSNDLLKADFADYKKKVKNAGGRIAKSTATSIIYSKSGLIYFTFYNPQGGVHEFSSRRVEDIQEYHDSFFGIK